MKGSGDNLMVPVSLGSWDLDVDDKENLVFSYNRKPILQITAGGQMVVEHLIEGFTKKKKRAKRVRRG